MAKLKESQEEELRAVLKDPALFVERILRHNVWETQRRILRSVIDNPWTSVKACHSSGKTFVASCATLDWLTRYPDGIVVTTAPTEHQVKNLLWREIRKTLENALIAYPKPDVMKLEIGPGRYAIGRATNEGINFQGFHGRVLIIIDEAPGVENSVYEAIEGIRAGGHVHVLELGNPTVSSGGFFDSFSEKRANRTCITISAFDTPNLEGLDIESLMALPDAELNYNPRPYLTTRRWVKEKYEEWGPTHPLWESRVLGNFPKQAEGSLLDIGWIERAARNGKASATLNVGIDVAGDGGDETVMVVRSGESIVDMDFWAEAEPRGEVVAKLHLINHRVEAINVDSAGIGFYFTKHLWDIFGDKVHFVNVGTRSSDPEKYVNLKSELYFGLRERFKEDAIAGLKDATAFSQLAGIRYRHNARGQVVIESKDEARKRGVRSPDRAEAIMLAYAVVPESEEETFVWIPGLQDEVSIGAY